MYVELLCKSNFSFLRGASDSREYVIRAHELGMKAVGICDINGVYALPRAFEALRENSPDLKLICGAEVTVLDHAPLHLIAKTRKAYGVLCRILTQVHADKEKGQGFITLSELMSFIENFEGGRELICIASVGLEISLHQQRPLEWLFLKALFQENLYVALCRYLDGLDDQRTRIAQEIAREFQLSILATNDVHYHSPHRRPLQDCLSCIREGVPIDEAGFKIFANGERFLKSPLQMQALFADLPEALHMTNKIAEQCTFKLTELKYSYPQEFIPSGHSPQSYLNELVQQGAHKIYQGLIPSAVQAQIQRELDFFAARGIEHYFLTVHDIVRFAQEKNIICQGRGSAANSIVCYTLGITSVDPIKNKLLFDRFMNEGRDEPPDIDVDFEHERREEVIQYIYQRFGRERAAMVAAVHTYRRKGAFRELSKALGINVGTLSAGELQNRFAERAQEKNYRRLHIEELVEEIRTFPRHLSIHSGGFVLSHDPLVEMVPIEPARMENRTIIQWDKEDLETLGLMKVDILSIGFLTVLHKATDLAGIGWRDIPDDDVKTYHLIQKAETHGTFQIESRAQMAMLVQTLPRNYYDLVIEVALVRPSPTVGGMIQPFLKGLRDSRRGKPFRIGNAALENILERTHGVPIFQEQIMQISIDVAGFTPSEADQLRRSLALQRSAATVDAMGKKLYAALLEKNIPKKFADDLFEFVKGYAHYGFPESHAASYASLAYKSAYMKAHHPAELLCALINSQPMGFYSIDTLINEAKRNSAVRILPVHPNKSNWDAVMEGPHTLRMGFRNLAKVSSEDIRDMLEERRRGFFVSIEDFIYRTNFRRDAIESFAKANVFSDFGLDQRHSFWKSIEFAALCEKKTASQLSLFNESTKLRQSRQVFAPLTLLEEISLDYKTLGYSTHGSFMRGLRSEYPQLPPLTSDKVRSLKRGAFVRYAGILTALQRPPPAKGTAFLTLEDENGSTDLIVRKEIYDQYEVLIRHSRLLIIEGQVQRKGQGVSVSVSKVESFSKKAPTGRPTQHGQTRNLAKLSEF